MNKVSLKTIRGCLTGLFFLFLSLNLQAQWLTESYTLLPGWNGIYLSVDASHTTIDDILLGRTDILEIWRWNPGSPESTFIENPDIPETGVSEWSIWRLGDPDNTTMTTLLGNRAYLVKVDGSVSVGLSVKGKPQMPSLTWNYNGLNLFGFPVNPTGTVYFDKYLESNATLASATIYQYVGGDLGLGNPAMVFNKRTTAIRRGKAYWIESRQYSEFYGPVRVRAGSGLAFGRTTNLQRIYFENVSSQSVVVTVTPSASEAAPAGEDTVAGAVPISRRTYDTDTGTYLYTPISAPIQLTVAPNGVSDLVVALDRTAMAGDPGTLYQSLLTITDDGALTKIVVPVSAEVDSLAGLWVGEAAIDQVQNQLQRFVKDANGDPVVKEDGSYELDTDSTDTDLHATAQTFALRMILHVDAGMVVRMLSEVYVGTLASTGDMGVATSQDLLQQDSLANAIRISSANLPPALVMTDNSNAGVYAVPTTLSYAFTVGYNSPHNPFVHKYHPDHDNLDARFESALPAGVESYNITRAITLTFESDASALGMSEIGWGASVLGGYYQETLTGLHKNSITTRGIFIIRRVSELDAIEE
jgi:hypothetical protein